MSNTSTGELLHERALAERTAWIRVVLTLASFAIIVFDPTVPPRGTFGAYAEATAGGTLFLLYAVCAWWLLRTRRIPLHFYSLASPLLDVFFASLLLITSQVFNRPFNLWFVFAIMVSGFSRFRTLPFVTAGLALMTNVLIALASPGPPASPVIFAVRTGYLFAIAAVVSSVGFHLLEDSKSLAVIEEAGRKLALAMSEEDVTQVLLQHMRYSLAADSQKLCIDDGPCVEVGRPPSEGKDLVAEWDLSVGQARLGTLRLHRRKPLTQREESLGRALCDRAASAVLRVRLYAQLTEAAVSSERLKLADRLHDTYLQSLAALDLRAAAARGLADPSNKPLLTELNTIKEISRQSAAELREIFDMATTPVPAGPAAIETIIRERWPHTVEVDIAPDTSLSEHQWRVLEMVVREGLNNAQKHAKASRISLRIHRTPGGNVACALQNDGLPIQTPIRAGYGLSRLSTLVDEQGGKLRLEPLDAGGATLIAEFVPKS